MPQADEHSFNQSVFDALVKIIGATDVDEASNDSESDAELIRSVFSTMRPGRMETQQLAEAWVTLSSIAFLDQSVPANVFAEIRTGIVDIERILSRRVLTLAYHAAGLDGRGVLDTSMILSSEVDAIEHQLEVFGHMIPESDEEVAVIAMSDNLINRIQRERQSAHDKLEIEQQALRARGLAA